MDNRNQQPGTSGYTNIPPQGGRPDSFFGTDYPPSAIPNNRTPSDKSPMNATYIGGNRARPVPDYYGGPPGQNRARNYNMANDYYYGQQPQMREPCYRDYPVQYIENYYEQNGRPRSKPCAQDTFFGADIRGPPTEEKFFPLLEYDYDDECITTCGAPSAGNINRGQLPMANDYKTPQRGGRPNTPTNLSRGKISDKALATSLINDFLVLSSVPCGKEGPCLTSAFSKDSIGAGPYGVDSSSLGTSKDSSEKSRSNKSKKSKIPKKKKTPSHKSVSSNGSRISKGSKGSKKGKSGSKKSKKRPKSRKSKQKKGKKLEDTKKDSINMLSVTISTVMLLAADIKTIPDNYISWTYKYLKCIKNCQGQHPPNIGKILKMLQVDETTGSVIVKNSVDPLILKSPNNSNKVQIVEPNQN